MEKNIVKDFVKKAYDDDVLIESLIDMMIEVLRDDNDGEIEWETNIADDEILFVTFSNINCSVDMFTEDGEEIMLSDNERTELENAADKIVDYARSEAEDSLEEEQAIRDTEDELRRWV